MASGLNPTAFPAMPIKCRFNLKVLKVNILTGETRKLPGIQINY
jgi:hypothetical protein